MCVFINRVSIIFIAIIFITACGGEGDTKTEIDPLIPVGTTDNGQQGTVNVHATKTMQELVAAEDFLFTTKQSIHVSISLPEYETERAYISVYRDYQLLPSGRYYPDASSRIIAGNLKRGEFESRFVALNKQAKFLVEVWFYDGQDALQKEVYLVNNELIW